jgi:hypothetical protein
MNNIFEKFVIANELIVNEENWSNIVHLNSQEFIIKEISDAIVLFNINLPYRDIILANVKDEYLALKNNIDTNLFKQGKWVSKFNYKYPYIDYYIDLSNVGNKASDYFHQVERWKCDATGYPSPQKTWENEKFRLTLFKALFSLKVKEINPTVLRSIISLRKYIAAQFRPSAAKTIYEIYKPETVLDFSMGWGDRLLAAHASHYVKRYVGIDPNINLFEGYGKQVRTYDAIWGKIKEFELHCGRAEDENIILNDQFDMIFTSPPYFDKEKYDQSDQQSYKMYHSFDSWMKDFLFKSIELRSKNLKSGGLLIINISDIYTRKKLYPICDGMNDFITSTGQYDYIGAIGLRMPKRPMSISSDTIGMYGEPIWIHRKK